MRPFPYRAPDDALELVSDFDWRAGVMPHQLVVMRIAQDQSILVVVERKTFRDGFNRFQETLSGERYLLFAEFEVSNVTAGSQRSRHQPQKPVCR